MNILTDALPKSVDINGRRYPINTDFRAGIAFECSEMNTEQDIYNILTLYYGDSFPEDIKGAINAIMNFYCCGEKPETEKKNNKPAYSFEADSKVIFADFWNYYNIDLSQEGLHWWVFRALLFGLPEESEFKQRTYYRTCDLKGLSKKERERIMRIRAKIAIKDKNAPKLTLEERDKKMREYILKRHEETKGG